MNILKGCGIVCAYISGVAFTGGVYYAGQVYRDPSLIEIIKPDGTEETDKTVLVITAFGLGAIIEGDSASSVLSALEKSMQLAEDVGGFNEKLVKDYGTIDGIRFAAERVVDFLEKKIPSLVLK